MGQNTMLENMLLGKLLLAYIDGAGIFRMYSYSEGRGKVLLALPTVSLNTHNAEDKKEAGVGGRSQAQGTRQGLEDPGLQSAINLRAMETPGGLEDNTVNLLLFGEHPSSAGGRGWTECVQRRLLLFKGDITVPALGCRMRESPRYVERRSSANM